MFMLRTVFKTCVAVVLIVAIVFGALLVYWEFFERTGIYTEQDPQRGYTLHIYQIGAPGWPFGSVTTEIVIKQGNWKVVDKLRFELNNDGGGVRVNNLKEVRWLENTVEVVMRGFDDSEPTTYILDLTG